MPRDRTQDSRQDAEHCAEQSTEQTTEQTTELSPNCLPGYAVLSGETLVREATQTSAVSRDVEMVSGETMKKR